MISIHTLPSQKIWQKAAEFLLELLRTHQNEKVLLLLSGGSAVNLYERIKYYVLSLPAGEAGIKDKNIALAQIDERFQPGKTFNIKHLTFNREDTNTYQIEKTGLLEACDGKNIPYYLISQEGTLKKAVQEYNQTMTELFKEYQFKVAILGIGEDGHTAGLLPGYEKVWHIEKNVIGYDLRQNSPRGEFCRGGFPFRISLTPKALSQLDYGIVVAMGSKKKQAIKNALDPASIGNIDKYPAALLQKIKRVDLFMDISAIFLQGDALRR